MQLNAENKTRLSPCYPGSPFSYDLTGGAIVPKLFGLVANEQVPLEEIDYLRLATRDEVPAIYLLFNWLQFMPWRRSVKPVYILKTRHGQCIFLKLEGDTHFKLRQAIGRHHRVSHQRMAA
jgi:hypothetical protein